MATQHGLTREQLERLRDDIGMFAEHIVGEPLWPHQLAFARSKARTRSACCGRQSGKSRTMAVISLHEAFIGPDRLILVVSATESAARRLLSEVAGLASAQALAGSVVDESKSLLVLSNGSRIVSVPASERAVRGWTSDLLIVDEACFVSEDVWRAARYTTIARGGRTVLATTPWGKRDRFFAVAYGAGRGGVEGYESFTWPSTASPLVSEALLDEWRPTMTDREYRAEILAEWVDDAGAFFTADELEAMRDDRPMIPPDSVMAASMEVAGGVDWGFAHDASTLVLVGRDPDDRDGGRMLVPFAEENFSMPYSAMVDRVASIVERSQQAESSWLWSPGFRFSAVGSETNGVGMAPTQQLQQRLGVLVAPVTTTATLKSSAFGAIKMLAQDGLFRVARCPALLKQLAALEFEQRDSGLLAIAVPERAGHDDLAMGLALAVHVSPEIRVGETRNRKPAKQTSYSPWHGSR